MVENAPAIVMIGHGAPGQGQVQGPDLRQLVEERQQPLGGQEIRRWSMVPTALLRTVLAGLAALVVVSAAFLLTALGQGFLISTVSRNQFLASQAALVSAFLPAFILSGFIFEIASMPWLIRMLTRIIPARYFVTNLQTLFLAGDIWALFKPNLLILLAIAGGLVRSAHDCSDGGLLVAAYSRLARTEGLLFDPVYSGKALAGMIDYIRAGRFTPGQKIVFLHTGGVAGLFAYADILAID